MAKTRQPLKKDQLYTDITIHKAPSDLWTIKAANTLHMIGTAEQLIIWALNNSTVTKSEVLFLNETEPHIFTYPDIPNDWDSALCITQRTEDIWSTAAFGRHLDNYDTAGLLIFLAKLLPRTPEDLPQN